MRSQNKVCLDAIYKAGKCHFRQSGKQFWQIFQLYATRQPMVALRLDSVTY